MKLFVGGLSYRTTVETVRQLFEEWGEVTECAIATDRDNNNRSKGFAFVTMPISTQAERAMQQISGARIDGRVLRVEPSLNQNDHRRPVARR
jgi:RNA recognition motif-containing protein